MGMGLILNRCMYKKIEEEYDSDDIGIIYPLNINDLDSIRFLEDEIKREKKRKLLYDKYLKILKT